MFDWKPAKKICRKKMRTLGNMQENSSGVIETNCKELRFLKMQLIHLMIDWKPAKKYIEKNEYFREYARKFIWCNWNKL